MRRFTLTASFSAGKCRKIHRRPCRFRLGLRISLLQSNFSAQKSWSCSNDTLLSCGQTRLHRPSLGLALWRKGTHAPDTQLKSRSAHLICRLGLLVACFQSLIGVRSTHLYMFWSFKLVFLLGWETGVLLDYYRCWAWVACELEISMEKTSKRFILLSYFYL